MFIDVRKTHLIPVCNEKVFVELPDGRVVRLKKWLYGMRKAASSWEEIYTEKFVEKGFQPGSAWPVVFFNKETAVRVVVHGDDFTFSAHHLELVALQKWIESWCDIQFRASWAVVEMTRRRSRYWDEHGGGQTKVWSRKPVGIQGSSF